MSYAAHPTRAATLLLSLLAALVLTAAPAAGAARKPAFTPGSRYLALGDSVSFGYEESTVTPPPNYAKASSFIGFPEQIAHTFRGVVANASCPGETSASLINPKAQSNGCENLPNGKRGGYRTTFPLHVRYRGSQLSYGLRYLGAHRNTRLVSLMIGANDLFLCQETKKDACLSPAEQQAVFTNVASNVSRILRAIRKSGYRGQIVLVNYYSLDYANAFIDNAVRGLNRANDAAARRYGAAIADGWGEFLDQARKYAGNTCNAGLITRLTSGHCGVHPTYAGQALLAQAVLRAARL
jgi:lysophospholipase L1-like esterase